MHGRTVPALGCGVWLSAHHIGVFGDGRVGDVDCGVQQRRGINRAGGAELRTDKQTEKGASAVPWANVALRLAVHALRLRSLTSNAAAAAADATAANEGVLGAPKTPLNTRVL